MYRLLTFCVVLSLPLIVHGGEKITPHVTLTRGAINSVLIERQGHRLAVYGSPVGESTPVKKVLLTHHRRDVVAAARPAIDAGAEAVAPAAERSLIESPSEFWNQFTKARFHDYAQQSTKILSEPLSVTRWVKEGDQLQWHGLKLQVLDTPGYTRGAVSYVAEIDGKKIAFTGDLIYGDGKIFDLYSFQDAIPEANIRGYHGYGGRLAALIPSLRKVAAQKPDLLVPARGPVIRDPQAAIDKLVKRVQDLYRNYQSTNALNWYFKEERLQKCADRVLDKGDAQLQLMSYSRHEKAPDWVFENATSRMLISDDGHGFLLDCGYQRVIDAVKKLMNTGLVKQVDGIFVTHYHDDHTDMVQAAAEEFKCPIYSTREYKDVLERPHAYHLPAMTSNAMKDVKGLKSGHKLSWQEFELTFHFFPGQTYYHGAMLAEKKGEKPIMFVGDAFSPSGMDDYCVLNRNLAHDDDGFLLCFKKLRAMKKDYWLVNEHIPFVFEFNDKELDGLEARFRERLRILGELFPWDDVNYGIDEQWAFFYPYGVEAGAKKQIDLEVRITNHSPVERTFQVTPHGRGGMKIVKAESTITLKPRQSGKVRLTAVTPEQAGNYLVTADVISDGMEFNDWAEALITVK